MGEHEIPDAVSLRHGAQIGGVALATIDLGQCAGPRSGDSAGWMAVFTMTSAPLANVPSASVVDVLRGGAGVSLNESPPIVTLPAGVSTRNAAEPGIWAVRMALTFTGPDVHTTSASRPGSKVMTFNPAIGPAGLTMPFVSATR